MSGSASSFNSHAIAIDSISTRIPADFIQFPANNHRQVLRDCQLFFGGKRERCKRPHVPLFDVIQLAIMRVPRIEQVQFDVVVTIGILR
jgi:hypothetical protein